MTNEEWRSSVPNYEVSNLGRVRRAAPGKRTYAGRILKQQLLAIGYYSVRPTINGKNVSFYVHDLVAAAFIGPKPAGARVNHIDTVKTNNVSTNHEYLTHAGNMAHAVAHGLLPHGESHHNCKLTEAAVRQIRADRVSGLSYSKLSAKHGVSIATAFNIVARKLWSHVA